MCAGQPASTSQDRKTKGVTYLVNTVAIRLPPIRSLMNQPRSRVCRINPRLETDYCGASVPEPESGVEGTSGALPTSGSGSDSELGSEPVSGLVSSPVDSG
jgi:hypothetical protein